MAVRALAFQLTCRAQLASSARLTRPTHISRPPPLLTNTRRQPCRPFHTQNSLGEGASSTGHPPRRAVTVTNDDGRHKWSELSKSEKAARSTQQSVNFGLIAVTAAGLLAVAYFLYQELFAADSKTRQFNHAVDRVKADSRCTDLLGPASEIAAFGEPTSSKWARSRPLAHSVEMDRLGTTHFRMHFHVEGPKAAGVVRVHMTKGKTDDQLQYMYLTLNV